MNLTSRTVANGPIAHGAVRDGPRTEDGFPLIRSRIHPGKTAGNSQRPSAIPREAESPLASYDFAVKSHSGREGRLAWFSHHGLACLLPKAGSGHKACHERIHDFGWMTESGPSVSDNRYIMKGKRDIESAYEGLLFCLKHEMGTDPYGGAELAAEAAIMLCSNRVKCGDPPVKTKATCEKLFADTLNIVIKEPEDVKTLFIYKLLYKDTVLQKEKQLELTPRPLLVGFASNGKLDDDDHAICGEAKNENTNTLWKFIDGMAGMDAITIEIYNNLCRIYGKDAMNKTCQNIGLRRVSG